MVNSDNSDSCLRDRIVAKSKTMFCINGIKNVTMDSVAFEMGISKRTLYKHFKNKDELVLTVVNDISKNHQKSIGDYISSSCNTLDAMLKVYYGLFKGMHDVNTNYFKDIKRYYPRVFTVTQQETEIRIKEFVAFLEKGKEEGMIRRELNSEISARLMILQVNYILESDDIVSRRFSFVDVFETIFINFMRGVATPEGIRFITEAVSVHNKLK